MKVNWTKVESFGKPLTNLSVECGLSRCSLRNACKGSGKVRLENVKKMAEVLGCSVEDLI